MRRTDFLVSINWQCTLVDPAKAVYGELAALESADPSLSLSFLQGFPPADIAECGPSVIAYGRDQAAADNAADALMAAIKSRQDQFDGDYLDPEGRNRQRHAVGRRKPWQTHRHRRYTG